jgi:biotin carboxyl carrier protein
VSSVPLRPDTRPAPEPLPGPLQHLVEELAGLVHTARPPAAFYQEFLQRVIAALGAAAGAVWSWDGKAIALTEQLNLSEVGLDPSGHASACHLEILRRAAQRDRPVWVPPRAGQDGTDGKVAPVNLTGHGLLLAPVLVDGITTSLIEVWHAPGPDAEAREVSARFLTVAAGIAAAYRQRRQLQELQEQHAWSAQAEGLSQHLHGSLDPREVAYLLANQGRLLIGCDQVAVGVRHGKSVHVEAVSGANMVETSGGLVQSMRRLFDSVTAWGEPVVYQGTRDEALPPAVRSSLDAYLARSASRVLFVLPLCDGRDKQNGRAAGAVLLVECFEAQASVAELKLRAEMVASTATSALYNAATYRRANAGVLTKIGYAVQDWTQGKRGRVIGAVAAALILVVAALTLIPAPLRLEARGQLLPKDRQTLYAPRPGKVVELKTYHGDQVQKGQELLFLEDLDAHLKVEQLGVKIAYAEQRLAALSDQLAKASSNDERNALLKDRIIQEYELRKSTVERDILLQESRSPRKSPLTAPLSGKLVTFDAREQLVGKTVRPGDALVRIARVQGPWEIELNIPEAALAPIREGLRQSADGSLEVNLLLASQPLRTFKGRLRWDGLGGETTVKDNAVVLPAHVEIADPDLAAQLASLPVGLEVRARVDCGLRPVGTVWFGDLIEFIYERLLF